MAGRRLTGFSSCKGPIQFRVLSCLSLDYDNNRHNRKCTVFLFGLFDSKKKKTRSTCLSVRSIRIVKYGQTNNK